MRGVIVTKTNVKKEKKTTIYPFFLNYIFIPLAGGITGYLAFLTVIIISKLAGYLVGTQHSFYLDKSDLLLPVLGFSLFFIIKLTEKSKVKS